MRKARKGVPQSAVQRLILKHLESIGTSRYKFAEMCGWSHPAIYKMLARPTNNGNIERMLAVLGARLVLGEQRYRLVLSRRRGPDGLPALTLWPPTGERDSG